MSTAVASSRVIAHSANAKVLADYKAKGFIIGPWSPREQGYEIQREAGGPGRKAKVPASQHAKIREQLANYRRLREEARSISPAALAKKHRVTIAVIERIDAGVPYKNLPADAPAGEALLEAPSP